MSGSVGCLAHVPQANFREFTQTVIGTLPDITMAKPFSSWTRLHSSTGCYTGGRLVASEWVHGECLLTVAGAELMALDIASGQAAPVDQPEQEEASAPTKAAASGGGDGAGAILAGDDISATAAAGSRAVCVHASGRLVVRDTASGAITRTIKAPASVVSCAAMDRSGRYVAVGTSTGTVGVWDAASGSATHSIKDGLPKPGHVTHVAFHPGAGLGMLLIGMESGHVALYDLMARRMAAVAGEHFSAVTGFAASPCGSGLVSAGRDGVLNIWATPAREAGARAAASLTLKGSIPAGASVEVLAPLHAAPGSQAEPACTTAFVTAGENGHAAQWCLSVKGGVPRLAKVGQLPLPPFLAAGSDASRAVVTAAALGMPAAARQAAAPPAPEDFASTLVLATAAHMLLVFDVAGDATSGTATVTPRHCLPGFNDQVLGAAPLPVWQAAAPPPPGPLAEALSSGQAAAVVTNSELVQLVDVRSNATTFMAGHSDMALCVAASADGAFIATGSKDATVRLWSTGTAECVGVGEGHVDGVGAVALPVKVATRGGAPLRAPAWLASAAKDLTLKVWRPTGRGRLEGAVTVKAHTKDINAIAVAPNDQLLATASADKSVKLWRLPDLQLVGTLTGHKRGVWSAAFSPTEQVLATASSDTTVRVWDLATTTCLTTLEGHGVSVLSLAWLPGGGHIASAAGDGTVKVWAVKGAECLHTAAAHEDRVWSVAVMPPREGAPTQLLTAGGDSAVHVWGDTTKEAVAEAAQEAAADAEKKQALFNAMFSRRYGDAIALCLDLGFRGRLRDIVMEVTSVGITPAQTVAKQPTPAPAVTGHLSEAAVGPLPTAWHAAVAGEVAALDGEAAEAALPLAPPPGAGSGKGAEHGIALLAAVLEGLSMDQLEALVGHVRSWVTQGRTAYIATLLLGLLLTTLPQAVLHAIPGLPHTVFAAAPYLKRHAQRYERLLQRSYVLGFLQAQGPGAGALGGAKRAASPEPAARDKKPRLA